MRPNSETVRSTRESTFLESVTSVETAIALLPLARMVSTVSWMGVGPTACGNDVGAELGKGHGDLSTEPRASARYKGHAS